MTDSAVVLGSTQPETDIDALALARGGYTLLRRRSGGGAVVLEPGRQLWLDLFVPHADPLFDHDVSRAAHFVGELWQRALTSTGVAGPLSVHVGPMISTAWSRVVCFSGIGPGEVLAAGKKLVGVSQRRNRAGAWFFSMLPISFDPSSQAELVSTDERSRNELCGELATSVLQASFPLAPVRQALESLLGNG